MTISTHATTAGQASTVAATELATTSAADRRQELAGPSSLLPDAATDLPSGSAMMAQVAALWVGSLASDRAHHRELALTDERRIMEHGRQEIAAMRDQAKADRRAALVDGVFKVTGGALTFTGACLPAAKAATEAQAARPDWSARTNAAGACMAPLGDLAAQPAKAEASRQTQEAKRQEIHGKAASRRYDMHQGDAQASREAVKRALEFVQQIEQAKAEARRAALF